MIIRRPGSNDVHCRPTQDGAHSNPSPIRDNVLTTDYILNYFETQNNVSI